MDKKPIFEATEYDHGQRLDNFLLKQRKHVDKVTWYKLIRKGQIRVNGKRVKPFYKLMSGDTVRIPPHYFFVEQKQVNVCVQSQFELMAKIIFENQDFLVLNKPAGLTCHAGTGQKIGVIETIKSIADYQHVQLAHRLDKDTSGCLLMAKNRNALIVFQQAMKDHQVNKVYLAVLDGVLTEEVSINHPLDTENRVHGIRTVVTRDDGKSAQTQILPLQNNGQYSLVKCNIKSGRTHQIRVHAQSIGMPVLGDALYGQPAPKLPRSLYLHAAALSFNGMEFLAPIPKSFEKLFQSTIK